jgi:hypothetical protein
MTFINNRVIWDDNGTLKDISRNMSNFFSASETITFKTATDYVYYGSDLPFNHRYFEVDSANSSASSVSIDIWNGNEWKAGVDVIDGTSDGTNSMAQSGHISFTPDRSEAGWGFEDTTEDITELATLDIYKLYWMRMRWDADITFSLKLIGHLFSTDDDVGVEYPELVLSDVLGQFKASKTDWKEQHIRAAEIIIRDLRGQKTANRLISRNQLLDWQRFTLPAVHQVAIIAFRAFGEAYKDNLAEAKKDYSQALNAQKGLDIDRDLDGKMDVGERFSTVGFNRR